MADFNLQEALDRDSTAAEFIKETDNCAISMFSENSIIQMQIRGGALKSVADQPITKGNSRAECEPCGRVTFVSSAILILCATLDLRLDEVWAGYLWQHHRRVRRNQVWGNNSLPHAHQQNIPDETAKNCFTHPLCASRFFRNISHLLR